MAVARKSDAVKSKCQSKAGISFRANKHHVGWLTLNGRKINKVTVPMGRHPIPKGTYGDIARAMGLSQRELDQFVDCTFTKKQYRARLLEQFAPASTD
jgi:hypothetical protein